MKLNIGCGPFYKKGYVNVDPYEKIVADEFYPSWLLPYKDNTIDEIVSSQVVEHLGYIETLYSLSEWYRVLKNNGKMVIETVDLEKTLSNKSLDKNWLWGLGYQGMVHKYIFDENELTGLLAEIGFDIMKIDKKMINNKPVLRIVSKKSLNNFKLIICHFRRRLLEEKIINLNKITKCDVAYEKIFKSISEILATKNSDKKKIIELLKLIGSFNPKISKLFFSLLIEKKLVFEKDNKSLDKAIKISQQLEKEQLLSYLTYLFYKTKKATSLSRLVFERIKSLAFQYIEGLFLDNDKGKLLTLKLSIFGNLKPPRKFPKLKHFSTSSLKELSSVYEAKGVKFFAKEKLSQAESFFKTSIRFNSESFFSYWNLARLYLVKGNIPLAIINYQKAFETVSEDFRSELNKEINDVIRNKKKEKYLFVKENVYY